MKRAAALLVSVLVLAFGTGAAYADECPDSNAELHRQNQRRVAHVHVMAPSAGVDSRPSEGSGFLAGNGWVLTARHVIEPIFKQVTGADGGDRFEVRGDADITLRFHDGLGNRETKEYKARYAGAGPWDQHDVVLLEVTNNDNDLRSRRPTSLTPQFWTRAECFEVLGITKVDDKVWFRRVPARPAGGYRGWLLELRSSVPSGISGGPVFSPRDGWGVVGVIVSRVDDGGGERRLMVALRAFEEDLLARLREDNAKPPKPATKSAPMLPAETIKALRGLGIDLTAADVTIPVNRIIRDPPRLSQLVSVLLKIPVPAAAELRNNGALKTAVVRYRDMLDLVVRGIANKPGIDADDFGGLVARTREAWNATGSSNRQDVPWGAEPREHILRLHITDLDHRTNACERLKGDVFAQCIGHLASTAEGLQALAEEYAGDAWEWLRGTAPLNAHSALPAAIEMVRHRSQALAIAARAYRSAAYRDLSAPADLAFHILERPGADIQGRIRALVVSADRLIFGLGGSDKARLQVKEHVESGGMLTNATSKAALLTKKALEEHSKALLTLGRDLCADLEALAVDLAREPRKTKAAEDYRAFAALRVDTAVNETCDALVPKPPTKPPLKKV